MGCKSTSPFFCTRLRPPGGATSNYNSVFTTQVLYQIVGKIIHNIQMRSVYTFAEPKKTPEGNYILLDVRDWLTRLLVYVKTRLQYCTWGIDV